MYFDIQAGGHDCFAVMYVIFIFSSSYLLNFFDPAGWPMMVCGFPHSMAHRKFPCVAWIIIIDKVDKPCLLQATGRPFKSRDLALSREVNRQGQRNRAILSLYVT